MSSPENPTSTEGTRLKPPVYPWILPGTGYRVLAEIAKGGMGQVFEAEHIGLRKRVVLKLLHEKLGGRPDLLDRMRLEAQALALLSHPNIVQVSDFGVTDDGRAFLVMERLLGKTLGKELKDRRALPPAEAIAIVQQVLAGLGAAHAVGIIHRDIKLENVFLCDAEGGPGFIKLLDFGMAKLLPEDATSPSTTPPAIAPLQFPTEVGRCIGTPRFFSPEQARGRPVDVRSDIYAVGLLLYNLVAGKEAFGSIKSLNGIIDAHVFEVPEPPSRIATQPIPEALDRAILKALAKRPDDRFQTAAAFSTELAKIAASLTAGAALVKPRWETTEPMKPMDRASLAALPALPSTPPAAPLLASTERLPSLASILDAERRPTGSGALNDTAPLPPLKSSASTAITAPTAAAATATGPSDIPAQRLVVMHSAEDLQRSTRFAFVLSFLASALLFGAVAAVLLLTLLR